MRLAWTTDLHLNFVDLATWEAWIGQIRYSGVDGLMVTGDIAEADDLAFQVDRLDGAVGLPIYFVLGNHDFYRSSIQQVRRQTHQRLQLLPHIHYLTGNPPIYLSRRWALVGHDGWGDARCGNYEDSPLRLTDFQLIQEFRGLDSRQRKDLLLHLGGQAASELRIALWEALESNRNTMVLTHVPPFVEACLYQGIASNPDWSPFFVCGAVGDLLQEAALAFPELQILVLCGHSHHAADVQVHPNLRVRTGHAEYGKLKIMDVLEID